MVDAQGYGSVRCHQSLPRPAPGPPPGAVVRGRATCSLRRVADNFTFGTVYWRVPSLVQWMLGSSRTLPEFISNRDSAFRPTVVENVALLPRNDGNEFNKMSKLGGYYLSFDI